MRDRIVRLRLRLRYWWCGFEWGHRFVHKMDGWECLHCGMPFPPEFEPFVSTPTSPAPEGL